MKWDDIEQKADETVVRVMGEILGENCSAAESDVERIARDLLVDGTLEHENRRRARYDYQKAFARISRRRLKIIGWSICAVASMVCVAIGSVYMLGEIGQHEDVTILAKDNNAGPQVILQLGNGQKIELDNAESVLLQDMGQKIEVANGKVSYSEKSENTNHELVYNVLSVPQCAEYQVVLADGTKVWLNSDSELKYPVSFSGEIREVFIKGEAYFEVAKDSLHPFVVKSGDVDVKVLGTSFNIRAYQGSSIYTTLVSGSVKIMHHENDLVLKPGEQCEVEKNTGKLLVNNPDLDVVLAWKNGDFVYKSASLSTIMEEIQRYYGVEVEYVQDYLKERKFYLYIERSKRLEEVLQKLAWTGYVRYRLEESKVILYE